MKYKFVILFVLSSWLMPGISAQSSGKFFDEADAFFAKYVTDGRVDYVAIKSDTSSLNSVIELAGDMVISPSSSEEYKAYWINVYNVSVIKGVVDHFPLKSPLDVDGFFKTLEFKAAGKSLTLDAIENTKLRAVVDDPRIHFVLVCGAKGCPPIISKAYRPGNVNDLLEQQTRKALNDPRFIRVQGTKVEVSEIFKWYEEDFVGEDKTVLDYINSFRNNKIRSNSKVTYYPYNWNLNSK